jgi:hypothetical protein
MNKLNFISPNIIFNKIKFPIKKSYKMTVDNFEGNQNFQIPGKIIVPKNIIKENETKLKALSEKWKIERITKEELDKKTFGFTKNSEILNGRMAMFFFVTGLLTEFWTGQTIPGQIETLLRTLGII